MAATTRLDPAQALRLITQVLSGRISIPLSVIRARLAPLAEKVALDIESAAPGLRLRGEARALGAPIRFAARLDADGIYIEGARRTVCVRISEAELTTAEDAPGPLADAIRNGMIDTANPATLIGNMMSLPDMIVRAQGQEVILDLMRIPAIERDEMLSAAIAAATSYLCVTGIQLADDTIVLRLGVLPGGPKEAALSTARAALTPVIRYLWPKGRP